MTPSSTPLGTFSGDGSNIPRASVTVTGLDLEKLSKQGSRGSSPTPQDDYLEKMAIEAKVREFWVTADGEPNIKDFVEYLHADRKAYGDQRAQKAHEDGYREGAIDIARRIAISGNPAYTATRFVAELIPANTILNKAELKEKK